MKKLVMAGISLLFLGACSDEYVSEFNNETFTLGNSLTYDMPILESGVLQPSIGNDISQANYTRMYNTYWLSEQDNILAEVKVQYDLERLDSEYFPYYVYLDEDMSHNAWREPSENWTKVDINGREWIYAEHEPFEFESEGETMNTVEHVFSYRSGFEMYTYSFTWSGTVEEFADQDKTTRSMERMFEVLDMADFTHEPTNTEEDVLQILSGEWNGGNSGYLHFDGKNLKWYKDSSKDENNVLIIEIIDVIPVIHPENNTEYAVIQMEYLKEVIDGTEYQGQLSPTMFVNFEDPNQVVLIDYDGATHYMLEKVQ